MWIKLVGLGPGSKELLTPAARHALKAAEVVVGYEYYFQFVQQFINSNAKQVKRPLTKELERAALAIQYAKTGKKVVLIGSGDTGVYSMANLLFQEAHSQKNQPCNIDIQVIPGISACLAAASRLGAPLADDFCCISLSDKQTPWADIEQRINAAAQANFVICVYNPKSEERYWQLAVLQQIILKYQNPETPVAVAKQVYRKEESIKLGNLSQLDQMHVDMFSLVIIGNSRTYVQQQQMVTPKAQKPIRKDDKILVKDIQKHSFNYIFQHLQPDLKPPAKSATLPDFRYLWPLLRVIHSTGDFGYQSWLRISPQAMQIWNEYLESGGVVVTDVEMVRVGIQTLSKGQVFCYLNDPESFKTAEKQGISRSQAGVQLGLKRHPKALFVIGNAPTALVELANAIQRQDIQPIGVIGTVVGFVNVVEAKQRLQACTQILQASTAGNKGGSAIAVAIINAALTYKQAPNWWQQAKLL